MIPLFGGNEQSFSLKQQGPNRQNAVQTKSQRLLMGFGALTLYRLEVIHIHVAYFVRPSFNFELTFRSNGVKATPFHVIFLLLFM
jgi:hypothetical protein